jgi:hypothetical protein
MSNVQYHLWQTGYRLFRFGVCFFVFVGVCHYHILFLFGVPSGWGWWRHLLCRRVI